MENLQYTFEEWKEGKFSIYYFSKVPKLLGDDIVQNQIPSVNWQIISKNEVELIKAEQVKIHKSKVDEGFNSLVNCFSRRVDISQISNILIDSEIKEVEKIVEYSSFINEEVFYVDFEVIRLDSIKIAKIYPFILNLKRGIVLNTDYISFPKSWTKREWSNYNIVIAESIWLYYNWLNELYSNENKKLDIQTKSPKTDYKTTNWFIVGLAFANGKMDELVEMSKKEKNNTVNFLFITRKMGDDSHRPYISQSYANYKVTDKNIFSDLSKINKIINHCKVNNIEIKDSFFKQVDERTYDKRNKLKKREL